MIHPLTYASVALGVCCTATSALAADDIYLALRGGIQAVEDAEHDNGLESDSFPGYVIAGALGYRFNDSLRAEMEIAYRRNTFGDFTDRGVEEGSSGHVSSLAAMLNGAYDIDAGSAWTPYFGAGFGWAFVGYDVDVFGGELTDAPFLDDRDGVFAYQAMAGLTYQASDMIDLSLGYRFFATLDPKLTDETGQVFDAEYRSHNIELGVAVRF